MLFKTTEEISLLGGAGSSLNFPTLSASIDAAELRYLLPAVGGQLFRRIDEAYHLTVPAWQSGEQDLLLRMQKVVAPFALALHMARVDVVITDNGITRSEAEGAKSAYKHQLQNARSAHYESGFIALEALVSFLEENASAWPEWSNSPNRSKFNSLFIRSGTEFAEHYRLRRPSLDFMALAPVMRAVENTRLRPSIGAHLDQLKAKSLAGTLSATEKNICELIKSYLAHQTISNAIPQLQLKLDDSGLTFSGFGDSGMDENSKAIAGSASAIQMLQASTAETARDYMALLISELATIDSAFEPKSLSFSSTNNQGSFAF